MASTGDDGEDLCCLGFKIEGADGVDQLFSGDVTTAIIVKHVKDLLELGDGLGVTVLANVLAGIESLGRGCDLGHHLDILNIIQN